MSSKEIQSKRILVIGSLSEDQIIFGKKVPNIGDVNVATKRHKELGGRGGNIAMSASRAAYIKLEDGTLKPADDNCEIKVKVMAAVRDETYQTMFSKRMTENLVDPGGIEIMNHDSDEIPDQDYMVSIMDGAIGQASMICGFETSDLWPLERFNDIEKLATEEWRPDLVVITMELKKQIVEMIIKTVAGAGIDVLLFATPGESISFDIYPLITHLICNESDAAKMLGYDRGHVNIDTWEEVCDKYLTRGVKNVAIKLGPRGCYYKNGGYKGFTSAHRLQSPLNDQTGSTTPFVGVYAVECVNDSREWDIKAATERAIIASSIFSCTIGYEASIPWSNEIDAVVYDPLHADMQATRKKAKEPFWS